MLRSVLRFKSKEELEAFDTTIKINRINAVCNVTSKVQILSF